MQNNLTEELLCRYTEQNRFGCWWWCLFLVPLTIGAVMSFVMAIVFGFVHGAFWGLLWLLGVAVLAFFAYYFGWKMYFHYKKISKVIKEERYIKIRAVCKSKKICQEIRDRETTETEDYCKLIFEDESKKYYLENWGTFSQIEVNAEYTIVLFEEKNTIDAILNKNTNEILYLN